MFCMFATAPFSLRNATGFAGALPFEANGFSVVGRFRTTSPFTVNSPAFVVVAADNFPIVSEASSFTTTCPSPFTAEISKTPCSAVTVEEESAVTSARMPCVAESSAMPSFS